jgi:hypothetical protein
MKNYQRYFPTLVATAAVCAIVALFPPGSFSWTGFFADPAPASQKLVYMLRAYGLPAALSFISVACFQILMRVSISGAPATAVFPLALFASGSMMGAFRTMGGGIAGVPGYALGIALGYTMMSRLYAIVPSGRTVFGKPLLKFVWRGDSNAVMQVERARNYARPPLAVGEERI